MLHDGTTRLLWSYVEHHGEQSADLMDLTFSKLAEAADLLRPVLASAIRYPSTAKVWHTLNIGKAPGIPNNLIISGAVHGQMSRDCLGVVCQTLPVVRYVLLQARPRLSVPSISKRADATSSCLPCQTSAAALNHDACATKLDILWPHRACRCIFGREPVEGEEEVYLASLDPSTIVGCMGNHAKNEQARPRVIAERTGRGHCSLRRAVAAAGVHAAPQIHCPPCAPALLRPDTSGQINEQHMSSSSLAAAASATCYPLKSLLLMPVRGTASPARSRQPSARGRGCDGAQRAQALPGAVPHRNHRGAAPAVPGNGG